MGKNGRITQSEIEIIASKCIEETIKWMVLEGPGPTDDLSADLTTTIRDELEKAGVLVQHKRRAIVSRFDEDGSSLRTVQSYLPSNFEARYFEDATLGTVILIEGFDRAGWTLDGYVIPRLASGLIVAKEVI